MQQNQLPPMDSELREVFRVAYVYRQKYQHPTGDEAFWTRAAEELCELCHHCKDHPLAKTILIDCFRDVEREYMDYRREQPT